MYIRTALAGIEPLDTEAWYLLMSHEVIHQRMLIPAAEWWNASMMVGWGQRRLGGNVCTVICSMRGSAGCVWQVCM